MTDPGDETRARLRALPSVAALLRGEAFAEQVAVHGHATVVGALRAALDEARGRVLAGGPGGLDEGAIRRQIAEASLGSLRAAINATGVVLHTNLGRAPLPRAALDAVERVGSGYSTVEFDLATGERGDRHGHPVSLLRELTGAEDALVVNNNAAALLLVLSALGAGREVVVSRGELVEIGGGFRIPDVLRQSGARLVEVGTTNKTYARDYREALSPGTAMLLKVHPSAFAVVGFVAEASVAELAALGRERGVPVVYDAGSGCFFPEEAGETIGARVREGADVVLFSGDKLLGGPQAGLIVGKASLLSAARRHPLMRALRPDKLTLAALVATLRLWRDAPEQIPVVRMFRATAGELELRARSLAGRLAGRGAEVEVVPVEGRMGGGAWPTRPLPGYAVRVRKGGAAGLAAALRRGAPPVVARVEEGAVLLDLRTVLPEHEGPLVEATLRAIDGAP